MDINSTPAAGLIAQHGGQTKFNLTTLKHDSQVNEQVALMASQAALPVDADRGRAVNTTA